MKKKYKNNPFKTPDGYFEGFKASLLDKVEQEKGTLPSEDGFSVPEGYFKTVKQNITAKVTRDTPGKVVQLHPYKRYYFAAASIAAIFLLVFGLQWFKGEDISFDSLANSEIENYLEDTGLGLSSYEIAEVVSLDELEESDILDDQLNEENIMEYLDENIDDFDELNFDTDE